MLQTQRRFYRLFWLLLIVMVAPVACTKDYFPVPPPPVIPENTLTLEATFTSDPPSSISHPFWSSSNFHLVDVQDMSTGNLYADGLMNMTGTYSGTSDFNNGLPVELVMKAAYDEENLFLLIEWYDDDLSLSQSTWLYDGPEDPLKNDDPEGWTSQLGNDKVALAFEIADASSSAGSFADVGCAASCHNNQMRPESGIVDLWNWSLALTEPLGHMGDMVADATNGLSYDNGQNMFVRNNVGLTDRSGPEFEWSGEVQTVVRADGSESILDPAFFLSNTQAFPTNIESGELAYHDEVKGCFNCHGENGIGGGDFGDWPSFTRQQVNRYSRENFSTYAADPNHSGFTYWNQNNDQQKDAIISYIRGLSGQPGYLVQEPSGSCADIMATCNTNLVFINTNSDQTTHQVLIIRPLDTGFEDDVKFEPSVTNTYVFGIALMDNDAANHIGSAKETLTFLGQ